jgi:hypothetical protein
MEFANAAGNTMTITAPKAQRVGGGESEDRDGKLADSFEFLLAIDEGNDQIEFVEAAS